MKFAGLGYNPPSEWETFSQSQKDEVVRAHQNALNEVVVQRGIVARSEVLVLGQGLHSSEKPTTVRMREGKHLVIDGPYAETKEMLGGFDVIDFPTIDAAVAWHKKVRAGNDREDLVNEIRPVEEIWWINQGAGHRDTTRFIFSLCVDEAKWSILSATERESAQRHQEQIGMSYTQSGLSFGPDGFQAPLCLGYMWLAPAAKAINLRMRRGELIATKGPYAQTRESLTGFLLLDCASRAEAVDWAGKLVVNDAQSVEIRVVDGSWFIYHVFHGGQ